MIYYPKSKILENQYTNGKEFVIKRTNKPYMGYYYIISDREYFTGRNADDPNKEELIKINKTENHNQAYNSVSKTPSNKGFIPPSPFYPQPTEEDYKLGFITRYFMKRRTDDFTKIVEISPVDFEEHFSQPTEDLDTSMYVAVKVNWKITGPLNNDNRDPNYPKAGVIETNQKLIKLKEKLLPGISFFIKDYSKFAK
jgi:hypothetical protein